ncbi:efflux RND transporter periplasmic adaptor subunit [Falsiroseomonas sp. HC035]|uniref:efflux RND transporter periplasmic adaptor subunit n=1 Tax=Falsiroseomonas sp. HC035 TaxID=3390999 RepID=UPI003D31BD1D
MFDSRITPDPAARTTAPRGRRRGWLVLGLLLALLAGGGIWLLRAPANAPAPPATPAAGPTPVLTVALATAATRPVATSVTADGSVVAWQELVIGAEIGGLRVVEAPVEEGQSVRAGDLLARLDDGVLAAQAAQAEAAILEADAARDLAAADLTRAESLVRTQSASVQVAEQRRAAALQAEARLASARARRDEAVARLAQTRILAPTDGIVARVTARIGAVTGAGQEMFRILRDGRLELDARVPELDLAAIRPGQAVTVRHGGASIAAEARAIAPLVAPDTRLGIVHVALPADSGLRPGMFAAAEIAGPVRQVVMVPSAAVVFRDGAPQAFVLPEGTDRVRIRRLVAGERQDGMVEIREGLAAGERVVVTGAGFLADGDLVRVSP